jgi:hypothetical protein
MAYNKCYIYRDKKYTWGIPDELADDFEDFFEKMVVDGTVERLQNVKKKKALSTPTINKSHSKSSSSVNGKSRRSSSSIYLLDSPDKNSLQSIVILYIKY